MNLQGKTGSRCSTEKSFKADMRSGLSLSLPAVASLDHDPLCFVDPSSDVIVDSGFWPRKKNQ